LRRQPDPRLSVLSERLGGVGKVVVFTSSKGGVGKTLLSVTTSLVLSRKGVGVGLLDIDVTNPTAHIALGVDPSSVRPVEEKGVVPPEVSGVKFMSPVFFTADRPAALRGENISSAIREIISITRWPGVDVLIVDTPPGMSDELLELITNIRRFSALVVTTPSVLSLRSAIKLVDLIGPNVSGVVVNMAPDRNIGKMLQAVKELNLPVYLLPYDPTVEQAIGNPQKILTTELAREVDRQITNTIINSLQSRKLSY
jgi:ATP-binding protein involved in chromosome partitioning